MPGGTPRPFDYDRTHVLTAVLEQPLGPVDLGARFRYATGMPRTPVVGAFYDVRGDGFQPIFGAHNSIRLPDHLQLDLRGALDRVLARDVISPLNVPGHTNSAMDGYALSSAVLPSEGERRLRVLGTAWAGAPFEGSVTEDAAV